MVLLAVLILKERLGPRQAVGLVFAQSPFCCFLSSEVNDHASYTMGSLFRDYGTGPGRCGPVAEAVNKPSLRGIVADLACHGLSGHRAAVLSLKGALTLFEVEYRLGLAERLAGIRRAIRRSIFMSSI